MQCQIEGEIYKAVMKVGVNVDKGELLKALQYDRNQYQKGYADRDSKIVRCDECKYAEFKGTPNVKCSKYYGAGGTRWFCADGERESD